MKLHLKLITNKPIKIDLDFQKNTCPSSSTMSIKEHSEQMLEVDFKVFHNTKPEELIDNLKKVIKRNYPNITRIEGLQQIEMLLG